MRSDSLRCDTVVGGTKYLYDSMDESDPNRLHSAPIQSLPRRVFSRKIYRSRERISRTPRPSFRLSNVRRVTPSE
jgi:hypothetical protein